MDSNLGTFDLTKVKEVLSSRGSAAAEVLKAPAQEPTTTVNDSIVPVDMQYLFQLQEEIRQLRALNYRLRKKNRNQKMALRQLNDAMIRKSWNLGKALVDRQSLEAALDAMFGIKVIK